MEVTLAGRGDREPPFNTPCGKKDDCRRLGFSQKGVQMRKGNIRRGKKVERSLSIRSPKRRRIASNSIVGRKGKKGKNN